MNEKTRLRKYPVINEYNDYTGDTAIESKDSYILLMILQELRDIKMTLENDFESR